MTLVDIESVRTNGQAALRHRLQISETRGTGEAKARKGIMVVSHCDHADAEGVMAVLAGARIRCDWVAGALQHLLCTGVPLEEARLWAALPIDPGTADRHYLPTGPEWSLAEIYLWRDEHVTRAQVAEHFIPGRINQLPCGCRIRGSATANSDRGGNRRRVAIAIHRLVRALLGRGSDPDPTATSLVRAVPVEEVTV